jgi:hypothetical protein
MVVSFSPRTLSYTILTTPPISVPYRIYCFDVAQKNENESVIIHVVIKLVKGAAAHVAIE